MDNKMLRLLLLDSDGGLKMAALVSLLERIRALVGPDASLDIAASSLKIQGAPETTAVLVAPAVSDDITYTSGLGETVTFHTVDATYGVNTVKPISGWRTPNTADRGHKWTAVAVIFLSAVHEGGFYHPKNDSTLPRPIICRLGI